MKRVHDIFLALFVVLLPAAAITVLLAGPAAAQLPRPSISLQPEQRTLTPDEIEKQKALDRAYRAANSKIPDKKIDDPWATVRPAPATASKKKQQ